MANTSDSENRIKRVRAAGTIIVNEQPEFLSDAVALLMGRLDVGRQTAKDYIAALDVKGFFKIMSGGIIEYPAKEESEEKK